jgi:Uma2 family endonuclease
MLDRFPDPFHSLESWPYLVGTESQPTGKQGRRHTATYLRSTEWDKLIGMSTTEHITTAEQLLQASGLGRCELIRGELITMSPAGFEHGWLVAEITHHLKLFVKESGLGRIVSGDPGFFIERDPDTVRAPDVAFVSQEKYERGFTRKFFEGAPDLAIEVVSPNDTSTEVTTKVQMWLDAGCRAVWTVDPNPRLVTVYRPDAPIQFLKEGDILEGGEVLPEFKLAVSDLFAR